MRIDFPLGPARRSDGSRRLRRRGQAPNYVRSILDRKGLQVFDPNSDFNSSASEKAAPGIVRRKKQDATQMRQSRDLCGTAPHQRKLKRLG